MSSAEDDRLRMMLKDASSLDARLAAFYPDAKTADWYTEYLGENSRFKFKEYEIVSGRTSVGLTVYEDFTYLKWDAVLPDALKLGEDQESYEAFLRFVFEDLPRTLYGLEEVEDIRDLYSEESKATVTHRNSSSAREYRFNSEKDTAGLITEYVAGRPIQSLGIVGVGPSSQPSNFWLTVNYGVNPELAILQLGFPLKPETAKAWNQEMLGWVLGSHVNRDGLSDVPTAAGNLRGQIFEVLKPVFLSKVIPTQP
ncbi:MAG: hypothetical protein KBD51_02290 [Candidatus Levybacteria bacterium]|nr:hypothetical protein [Candidatus Levybacteria bacterium]